MRINNNIMAMNTHRQLGINSENGAKSIEKLSSGYRINRAGDDAAGLAISEKMRAQIRGLGQASRNAQDSISLVQTAEGALTETHSILQRMRELAVQSANDTNVAADREAIQNEVDQLATEITRITNNTEFNERKLLNGGLQTGNLGELTFQIGANQGQNVALSVGAMDAFSLGVSGTSTTATVTGAVDVTAATVSGITGAALVDGAVIGVTSASVAATAGTAQLVSDSALTDVLDINLVTTGANGNNVSFELTSSGAAGLVVSEAGGVITIALGSTASNNTAAAIQTALQGLGTISNGFDMSAATATAGGSWDTAASETTTQTVAVTGGTNETFNVTFDDGGGTTAVVTGLTGSETAIAGTGIYSGLTLTTDGAFDALLAATVTLDVATGSAATFSADGTTTAAVATKGIDISTRATADVAITTINTAITTVSTERAKLGAVQNRLDHTIKNLDTASENLQASESRIRDVDMAKEMMNFTKNNILQQAAQAMLAQANQAPQGVLQLLR